MTGCPGYCSGKVNWHAKRMDMLVVRHRLPVHLLIQEFSSLELVTQGSQNRFNDVQAYQGVSRGASKKRVLINCCAIPSALTCRQVVRTIWDVDNVCLQNQGADVEEIVRLVFRQERNVLKTKQEGALLLSLLEWFLFGVPFLITNDADLIDRTNQD